MQIRWDSKSTSAFSCKHILCREWETNIMLNEKVTLIVHIDFDTVRLSHFIFYFLPNLSEKLWILVELLFSVNTHQVQSAFVELLYKSTHQEMWCYITVFAVVVVQSNPGFSLILCVVTKSDHVCPVKHSSLCNVQHT